MVKVVGVRFRSAGKYIILILRNVNMKVGTHVIVETARGVEYGTVMIAPREVADDKVVQPLKSVIRVATKEDDKTGTAQ